MNLKEVIGLIGDIHSYGFYYKLLKYKDLPEDIKERCYENILESPYLAYLLRRDVKDIPEYIKRLAEKKACEDPYWARFIKDI